MSELQNKKQELERNIVIMQNKLNVESTELTEIQKLSKNWKMIYPLRKTS